MKQLTNFVRTVLPWAKWQCRLSALSLMLLACASAWAQNGISVKGTVVDSNGEALIGASVVIKGNTSVGTVTDFDGNFTFSVPSESSIIVVSYVGMNTIPASSCSYCFMGEDMKPMTGEYLTPSKKPLVQRKQSAFPSGRDDLEKVYQFIKKHKPDVRKCMNGTVSE